MTVRLKADTTYESAARGGHYVRICCSRRTLRTSSRGLAGERQPLAVLGPPAVCGFVERLLDSTRNRPRFAAADRVAVDFANRRHLDRGSREEQLIGGHQV